MSVRSIKSDGWFGEHGPWLALAALALLLAFAFQGTRGLWDPDEGRLAQVASEMLATGDLLTPRLGGQPHFTKPPLTYWCIAASIAAFGRGELAVRLFLSIAFAATVMVVAAFAARLWDRRTGLWAGLIYATTLTTFVAANFVTPDTLLTLWNAIALYAFWRGFTAEGRGGRWGWPALTGAAMGLAFLTKGPPGLIFLPGMLLFGLMKEGRRRGAAPAINLAGLLLFVTLGLSWYLDLVRLYPGLLRYFLGSEVIGRLAGHHHRNSQWYGAVVIYGPVLLAGSLPWCLFWPRLWRRARAAAGHQGIVAAIRNRPPWLFLTISFLLPLAIFCIARSRLPLYVLPLFVPLSVATARAMVRFALAPAFRAVPVLQTPRLPQGLGRSLSPIIALWVAVLLAGRVGLAFWPTERDARRLYRSLVPRSSVEVVIDADHPHCGLAFYARSALEIVNWSEARQPSTALPVRSSIADEVAEDEHPGEDHLYLVDERKVARFLELLQEDGIKIRERRRLHGLEAVSTVRSGI